MTTKLHRILIFIVAYNAESTISPVLDRLPDSILSNPSYLIEVLIIDDCSTDQTVNMIKKYKRLESEIPLTILTNPVNLGYGGNQKLGYEYAIDGGFDLVVLLHGDGQYAPEELPNLIEPLLKGEAEAVFGSRMLDAGRALKGGMPIYKYLGNKVLTIIENFLVGTNLSEYHSGYRAYCTKTLNTIPFHLNSNDFDFDTDIIIQLHTKGARITEISIPSFYGDEICHVNGIQYAYKIILSCLESRLQKLGIFYNPKFDLSQASSPYQSKFHFDSSHSRALEKVKENENILSLGSGPMELIQPFIDKGAKLSILDQYLDNQNTGMCIEALAIDLDNLDLSLLKTKEPFDLVLALDIIEHLKSPEKLLEQLTNDERFVNTKIIITTPNIAFLTIRAMLLFGQFNYGPRGILDMTHTRLLTFRSMKRMLKQAGYKIENTRGIPAPFPMVFSNRKISFFLLKLNNILICLAPSLFSFQIYCEARIGSNARVLLEMAKKHSKHRELL